MKEPRTAENVDRRFRGLCAGCHAPIIWAITQRGRPIPLDADPVDPGNLVVEWFEWPHQPVASPNDRLGVGYRPHFASCPEAVRFRKRK